MAGILTEIDEKSGYFAVGKDDTIFATGKEIVDKAFEAMKNVIKNAQTGLTRIIDVGSRKISQRDHEGNTVAQRKMAEKEVGKFSSFLANVGKNIEKGLSKLGKGGKVAMIVSAMLLTAAMSQQLQAAEYIKGGTIEDVMKLAITNPGKCYLAEYEEARGASVAVIYNDGSSQAGETIAALKDANVFDSVLSPHTVNGITYGVVSPEFQDHVDKSDLTVRIVKEVEIQENNEKEAVNNATTKVAPRLDFNFNKINEKTAGYYNQDNKFVSFSKEEVKDLQAYYDKTFNSVVDGKVSLPTGMTGYSYASALTNAYATDMATQKENAKTAPTQNVQNTRAAKTSYYGR